MHYEIPRQISLKICLEQIFHRQGTDEVLFIIQQKEVLSCKDFKKLVAAGLKANSSDIGYTYDQCQLLADWYCTNYKDDFFSGINDFADILETGSVPFYVKLEDILRWHVLGQYLTEDLLVCAKLSYLDNPYLGDFSWNPYIRTNDMVLNRVIDKSLADVHAHLKGSSLNFDVNWLCLMNHISRRKAAFDSLESWRQNGYKSPGNKKQYRLYEKAVIASAIRLKLFCDASNTLLSDPNIASDSIQLCGLLDSIAFSRELQSEIDAIRELCEAKYTNEYGRKTFVVDYAINKQDVRIGEICSYSVLSGERYIMYSTMARMRSDSDYRACTYSLFYLYLLIKNEIRNELVQVNDATGFDNFNLYERRKTIFLEEYPEYEKLLVHLSVASFFEQNEKGRKHETRIAPKADYSKALASLKETEKDIQNPMFGQAEKPWNYGYDYHFIKKKDDTPTKLLTLYERHHALRNEVKLEAKCIVKLLRSNQMINGKRISSRICGIDAANSEIMTRPEVFAHAFRYLRDYPIVTFDDKEERSLGITYHVGEDFVDIVDGLRAIDELLLYMQYRRGDRMGHALVLGVDVVEYYKARNFSICMTKQMLIDNVVWLYHKLSEYGGHKQAMKKLLNMYNEQCGDVYGSNVNIDTYYCSWLLRGDDPNMYTHDGRVKPLNVGDWNESALNNYASHARNQREACLLYYLYHFDEKIKANGSEKTLFEIDENGWLLSAISFIQRMMCKKIQNMGVAVECNPTSNFKIGEFDRYDQHPIYRYYGFHRGKRTFSISSSINTDDKGIFSTSIEREYALIYAAFRRKTGQEKGFGCRRVDIEKWLNEIREFSNEQCFIKE